MKKSLRIGLIGAGYWGINLIRNFYKLGVLKTVVDNDLRRKKAVLDIKFFNNDYKLKDATIEAVVILHQITF